MKLGYIAARDYINGHPEKHLQRDKSNKGYICPLCGNGSGSEGTGLRLNPNDKTHTHYKCFRCGFYGDMIELIAQEKGITESAEAFEIARAIYGIEIDKEVNNMRANSIYENSTSKIPLTKESDIEVVKEPTQTEIKQAESYINQCRENITQAADYLKTRGISLNTASVNGLGYDPDKQAVVIPNRGRYSGSYSLRFTNPDSLIRYQNAKGMSVGLFLGKVNNDLFEKDYLFVTEGAFDALSIKEAGFDNAVALNSGNNADKFVDLMRAVKDKSKTLPKVIILMDNDEAGNSFSDKLSADLRGLGIACEAVKLPESAKDVNDLLITDPEALRALLCRVTDPDTANKIDTHKVGSLLHEFNAYVMDEDNNKCIPTGFECFDKAIGGGLYPKMYVIGAVASLGKTTFALQIADNIAAAGNDVIIFSLEMAKEDIIARSISRHTSIIAESKHDMRLAKTELGITSYNRYQNYSKEDREVIRDAYKAYAAYAADHISIYEGRYTADQIRDIVEQYIRITGRKPVVIVDYLQIVQAADDLKRGTIREQVDDVIYKFAAIRRDYKVPVVVVSSFNRNSYNSVADNTSFKESGGIEYTADCVMTLELNIEFTNDELKSETKKRNKVREAMRANPRRIKLTLHKNRGNRVGSQIFLNYDAKYSYFTEDRAETGNNI